MSVGPAVVFDNVSKKFRRGERHDSLRNLVPSLVHGLFRDRATDSLAKEEFWALRNVSFEVSAGEALGIIGPNGAGKSTTLKILTKILRPSTGRSIVKGRVGALIEVAAGFHPDLTGRENIMLQGAIMGMKRAEIAARFDEIVGFAGVSEFIDTPVKRYSSGMNARLGFSIAAHLNPDVLIIDEVLSVGDLSFHEKCVARMRQFKQEGVTIVFVSHNLPAINDLCDEAIYLNHRVRAQGPTADVIARYVQESFTIKADERSTDWRIERVGVTDADGRPIAGPVQSGSAVRFWVDCDVLVPKNDLTFVFRVVRATDQLRVYDGHFSQQDIGFASDRPGRFRVSFDFTVHVARGQYLFDILVTHNPTSQTVARLIPAGHLAVEEQQTWDGVVDLGVRPEVVEVSKTPAVAAGQSRPPATDR